MIFFIFYFIGDTTILEEDAASHEPRTSTSSRVRRDNHQSSFIIISSSHSTVYLDSGRETSKNMSFHHKGVAPPCLLTRTHDKHGTGEEKVQYDGRVFSQPSHHHSLRQLLPKVPSAGKALT